MVKDFAQNVERTSSSSILLVTTMLTFAYI
jgi:hypothetical protein